eukprot:71479_1
MTSWQISVLLRRIKINIRSNSHGVLPLLWLRFLLFIDSFLCHILLLSQLLERAFEAIPMCFAFAFASFCCPFFLLFKLVDRPSIAFLSFTISLFLHSFFIFGWCFAF